MSRARISTTVDRERLETSRRLLGVSDSQLIDRALALLIEHLERENELEALERQPYHDDPELAWEAPGGPSLPYVGEIPAEVIELAARRRGPSR